MTSQFSVRCLIWSQSSMSVIVNLMACCKRERSNIQFPEILVGNARANLRSKQGNPDFFRIVPTLKFFLSKTALGLQKIDNDSCRGCHHKRSCNLNYLHQDSLEKILQVNFCRLVLLFICWCTSFTRYHIEMNTSIVRFCRQSNFFYALLHHKSLGP